MLLFLLFFLYTGGGGDRYEGILMSGSPFNLYIPQAFSRSKPDRHKNLLVAFKGKKNKKRQREFSGKNEDGKKAGKLSRIAVEQDDELEEEEEEANDVAAKLVNGFTFVPGGRKEEGKGEVGVVEEQEQKEEDALRKHYESNYTPEARRISQQVVTLIFNNYIAPHTIHCPYHTIPIPCQTSLLHPRTHIPIVSSRINLFIHSL